MLSKMENDAERVDLEVFSDGGPALRNALSGVPQQRSAVAFHSGVLSLEAVIYCTLD